MWLQALRPLSKLGLGASAALAVHSGPVFLRQAQNPFLLKAETMASDSLIDPSVKDPKKAPNIYAFKVCLFL